MGFDFGAMTGNLSAAASGNTQPTRKVTDLRPHVDGGGSGRGVSNTAVTAASKQTLYDCIGLVLAALGLLWLSGALAFRTHNI